MTILIINIFDYFYSMETLLKLR